MPVLSILFFLIAIALFIIARQKRKLAGIPTGKIIYSDTNSWGKVEKPLYDPELRLTGKPDYLIDQENQVLPVEVKSGRSPQAPYDSHIFQLAAYCLLVQHEYGIRPNFGILHYPKRTYAIEFTKTLEESVKLIIHEMQGLTARSRVDRSHEEPNRCRHCGYRSICDQSLRI